MVIYFFLGRGPVEPAADGQVLINLLGLGQLFASIVVRWFVLPRFDDLKRALPIYIVGLALAESCGILGIFLGGAYRDSLFLLSVLGVIQFVPLFGRRLQEPYSPGFGRSPPPGDSGLPE